MVISSEGYFYSYNIDLENGGECSLMKQYRFVGGYIVKKSHAYAHIYSLLDSGEESSSMTD